MGGLGETELAQIVGQEVEKYAGLSPHAKAYAILDPIRKTFAVTAIENELGKDHDWIIVQAHIEDGFVVVDADNVFDKKLVYALEQAGVPREQIILAYEGEKVSAHSERSS